MSKKSRLLKQQQRDLKLKLNALKIEDEKIERRARWEEEHLPKDHITLTKLRHAINSMKNNSPVQSDKDKANDLRR